MRERLAPRNHNPLVLRAFVRLIEHRQRMTAFQVFLPGFDDPIVTIHPFNIRGDQFQAVKRPVNARPFAVIAPDQHSAADEPAGEEYFEEKIWNSFCSWTISCSGSPGANRLFKLCTTSPVVFGRLTKLPICTPQSRSRHQHHRQNAGYLVGQVKTIIVGPCQPAVEPARKGRKTSAPVEQST